jgi:hypothetical protein
MELRKIASAVQLYYINIYMNSLQMMKGGPGAAVEPQCGSWVRPFFSLQMMFWLNIPRLQYTMYIVQ